MKLKYFIYLAIITTSTSVFAAQPTATTTMSFSGEVVPNTCVIGANRTLNLGQLIPSDLISEYATSVYYNVDKTVTLLSGCIKGSKVTLIQSNSMGTFNSFFRGNNMGTMGGQFTITGNGSNNALGGVQTVDDSGNVSLYLKEFNIVQYNSRYGTVQFNAQYTVTYQ